MSYKDWKSVIFADVVEVNPFRKLKKKTFAKSVSMANVKEFEKFIFSYEKKEYSGGSKFTNGDILFARITPCLENGKTAYVNILDNGEIGFGSTEFIVLSAKKYLTDSNFVYYLARSPEIRLSAIKSMTGSSGRQRVPIEFFKSLEILLPSIEEQKSIAAILSSFDNKIEINNKINQTLEEMAQTIFKHWFVDFEFPNENGKPYKSSGGEMIDSPLGPIPKGWEIKFTEEVTEIVDCLHSKKPDKHKDGRILLQVFNLGEYGLLDLTEKYFISDSDYKNWTCNIEVKKGDCLLTNAGKVGAIGQIPKNFTGAIGRNLTAVRPSLITPTYLFEYFTSEHGKNEIHFHTDIGTIFNSLNVKGIKKIRIIIPSEEIMKNFEIMTRYMREKMEQNVIENTKLAEIRNLILPKLISGEISVNLENGGKIENLG